MRIVKRTCWLCRKSRESLSEVDKDTIKMIKSVFKTACPDQLKQLCYKCSSTIKCTSTWIDDRPNYVPIDSCFGCRSENVIKQGQAFLDQLLADSRVITLKKTKHAAKSCTECLTNLKRCVKMESSLKSVYSTTGLQVPKGKNSRVSAKFATLKDLNIKLAMVPVKALEEMIDEHSAINSAVGRKRKNMSVSPVQLKKSRYNTPSTPVRGSFELKKLMGSSASPKILDRRRTISPTKGKQSRMMMKTQKTPASVPKKRSPKKPKRKGSPTYVSKNDRIFVKFESRRARIPRISYGKPHSASKPITDPTNLEELEKLFEIKFRTFDIKVDKIDPTVHFGGRLAVVGMRPSTPENNETIGLDDEDMDDDVEITGPSPSEESRSARKRSTMLVERHNEEESAKNDDNGKRKSILVTDRTESPRTVNKKVKFNDDVSTEEDEKNSDDEDKDDGNKDNDSKNKEKGVKENADSNKNADEDDNPDKKSDNEYEDAEDTPKETSKENEVHDDSIEIIEDEPIEKMEDDLMKKRKKTPSPKLVTKKSVEDDEEDDLELPKTPPRRNGSADREETDGTKNTDKDSGASVFDLLKDINQDETEIEKVVRPSSALDLVSDTE